ncbi:MAG: DUF5050 domain-containing protein [candidate division KSB1 bacterium]|nr:DUF5050 domain-containing protein [candidate division KSB1 bacterium]
MVRIIIKRGIWKINTDGTKDHLLIEYGTQPCYMADGKMFVYCDYADRAQVYKYFINDSSLENLTNMKWNCLLPKVSPDGKLIVFMHYANYLDYYNIYIMNSDGSNLRLLTTKGYYPSFSPDSKWVVYTNTDSRDGRIWKTSVTGGEKIAVTPPAPDSYFDEHDNSPK